MDTADFNAGELIRKSQKITVVSYIGLGDSGFKLDPADFKGRNIKAKRLSTTDGTTLLGADDKSGIAEIMSCYRIPDCSSKIKHCEIRVGLVQMKEIGVGANKFDARRF